MGACFDVSPRHTVFQGLDIQGQEGLIFYAFFPSHFLIVMLPPRHSVLQGLDTLGQEGLLIFESLVVL